MLKNFQTQLQDQRDDSCRSLVSSRAGQLRIDVAIVWLAWPRINFPEYDEQAPKLPPATQQQSFSKITAPAGTTERYDEPPGVHDEPLGRSLLADELDRLAFT